MREAFDKEIKAKDKTIEELNRKVNDLDQRNGQMEMRLIKESGGSDKVVTAVTEGVAKAVTDQNIALKNQLDEILKAVKSAPAPAQAPVASAPAPQQPVMQPQQPQQPQEQPRRSEPRDPNTKRVKMSW